MLKSQPKQFFWRGKSDGVWLSHLLFRDRGNGTQFRRNLIEPCGLLEHARVPLPEKGVALTANKRKAMFDVLNVPATMRNTMDDAELFKRFSRIPRAPTAANFTLRRRIVPRRGSVLALGERANLDVNTFNCPKHLSIAGCDGPPYDAPFLGAFLPGRDEWSDTISAAPPFKYCRDIRAANADARSKRIPGVALLLPELHSNLNVGHWAKDLLFFAHVLAEQRAAAGTSDAFTVSTILLEDRASATGNMSVQQGFHYKKASIDALVAGFEPPIHVAFMQQGAMPSKDDFGREPPWVGHSSVCFDVLLQKGLAYAGDWRGAGYSRKVYDRCGIEHDAEADTILIVVHGTATSGRTTRRWYDQEALVESVKARAFAKSPRTVLVKAMEGLSFCEQAALYARSKVVITHHGASLANGYFLRGDSIMVELNRQWRVPSANEQGTRFAHTFDGAGYAGLFVSSGVGYIGARVAYGVWPKNRGRNSGQPDLTTGEVYWDLTKHRVQYDFNDPDMAIGVNATRWNDILDEIDSMVVDLAASPPPKSSSSSAAATASSRQRGAKHGKAQRKQQPRAGGHATTAPKPVIESILREHATKVVPVPAWALAALVISLVIGSVGWAGAVCCAPARRAMPEPFFARVGLRSESWRV